MSKTSLCLSFGLLCFHTYLTTVDLACNKKIKKFELSVSYPPVPLTVCVCIHVNSVVLNVNFELPRLQTYTYIIFFCDIIGIIA